MTGSGRTLRVAVVLCTYNGERFLDAQLQSLLRQTHPPAQVVIQDDCSVDSTMAIIELFSEQARGLGIEVRQWQNPANLGYLRNFESALQRAAGDLIFLCDQDDVWRPDKIARMIQPFIERSDLLLLHSDARLIDAAGQPFRYGLFDALGVRRDELDAIHRGDALEVLLRRSVATGAATAFRRELLAHALPFPDGWVHDEWLAIRAAALGGVDCITEPLVDYRQHGGNQIGVARRPLFGRSPSVASRRAFLRMLRDRLHVLQEVLAEAKAPDPVRRLVAERIAHAETRAGLPESPVARLRKVLSEAGSGRYHRFSMGLRSVVADLFGLD